jgi:hypothetical protein
MPKHAPKARLPYVSLLAGSKNEYFSSVDKKPSETSETLCITQMLSDLFNRGALINGKTGQELLDALNIKRAQKKPPLEAYSAPSADAMKEILCAELGLDKVNYEAFVLGYSQPVEIEGALGAPYAADSVGAQLVIVTNRAQRGAITFNLYKDDAGKVFFSASYAKGMQLGVSGQDPEAHPNNYFGPLCYTNQFDGEKFVKHSIAAGDQVIVDLVMGKKYKDSKEWFDQQKRQELVNGKIRKIVSNSMSEDLAKLTANNAQLNKIIASVEKKAQELMVRAGNATEEEKQKIYIDAGIALTLSAQYRKQAESVFDGFKALNSKKPNTKIHKDFAETFNSESTVGRAVSKFKTKCEQAIAPKAVSETKEASKPSRFELFAENFKILTKAAKESQLGEHHANWMTVLAKNVAFYLGTLVVGGLIISSVNKLSGRNFFLFQARDTVNKLDAASDDVAELTRHLKNS